MDSIEAFEAAFTRDSQRLFNALAEAKKFKKGETIRLNGFTTQRQYHCLHHRIRDGLQERVSLSSAPPSAFPAGTLPKPRRVRLPSARASSAPSIKEEEADADSEPTPPKQKPPVVDQTPPVADLKPPPSMIGMLPRRRRVASSRVSQSNASSVAGTEYTMNEGSGSKSAPMKSLPTPSTALFDEIMPELAGYEIDYDDDFRHHESYATIITAFRRLQASENGLDQAAKIIQNLAAENYILRLKNVALTSEDHQREFLRSHGKPFNAKVFRRKVPDHVSSKRPAECNNYFGAFNEFSGAFEDKALILKELKEVPTASTTKTFYHPFHSRYIPSLWGMGVVYDGDDPVWEEADEDQIYFLAGYMNVGEPGGKERWIPNVCEDQIFTWALE
ncbi:hypothetical protein IWX90DRAFT_480047 [Phyllosticta citrichinensis]|uniref:Uncharacterized protein n=1 Tax=Phyllosticta citrichinensis TaxID=1130410 RepID=A0ABR1XL12_9PEZI